MTVMRKESCVAATVLCALAATSAAQEQVWSIAPESSQVRIDVGKSGLFSAAGHTHEVIAPAVSGRVRFDPNKLAEADISLITFLAQP